ncbi:hypothetical protein [uncultured Maritalea sp.]|uniref:hypothetical protein n=1 Tax=uncultured Maritalea sp. TaxID=757249 RepID=UPI002636C639|nr:hypothetical protein [uncultured Maritalea sp.]
MGMAKANGENRAQKAVENAISSPLLNDSHIKGAKYVLLNITFGSDEISMDEITEITDFIQDEAGATADVIWGYGQDEELGNDISITLIATGFETSGNSDMDYGLRPQKKVIGLEDELPTKQEAPVIPAPVAKMETAEKQPEIFAEERLGKIKVFARCPANFEKG